MSADPGIVYALCTHRRLARVVIEFTTPFHVGTGRGAKGIDALVVTDANGLPTIPGSSLAGALRAGYAASGQPKAAVDALFGFQDNAKGAGSRLSVSWACLHNSKGKPVEGIVPQSAFADPVLENSRGLRLRDHVRLHHQGAAMHGGKFDEWPVCAGHRFTFELEFVSDASPEDAAAWAALLGVLRSGVLRLGGKTRRGFGSFKVVALREDILDLSTSAGFAAYRDRPASLADPSLRPIALPATAPAVSTAPLVATLKLRPVGYWIFGGGEDPDGQAKPGKAPVRDARIEWSSGKGEVVDNLFLLPGSSIKGALSHRVAWHWNKADHATWQHAATALQLPPESWENSRARPDHHVGENNPAVQALFGFQKNNKDGRRGCVLIDDVFLAPQGVPDATVTHVAIDRVTGGALQPSRLFTERPLWQSPAEIELRVVVLEAGIVSAAALRALDDALRDLCEGRLALGAGGGRDKGYFTGTLTWSDGGKRIAIAAKTEAVP